MKISDRKIKMAVNEAINEMKGFDGEKFAAVQTLQSLRNDLLKYVKYLDEDEGLNSYCFRLRYGDDSDIPETIDEITFDLKRMTETLEDLTDNMLRTR